MRGPSLANGKEVAMSTRDVEMDLGLTNRAIMWEPGSGTRRKLWTSTYSQYWKYVEVFFIWLRLNTEA